MIKIVFAHFLLIVFSDLSAQNIEGKWYSADHTRIYEICRKADYFEISISSSSRKNDPPGFVALPAVFYKSQKKRYEGSIYSTETSQPAWAKIKYQDKKGDVLRIRIRTHCFFPHPQHGRE